MFLLGNNFGPLGTYVTVTYTAKDYQALSYSASCFVSVAHTNVTCRTVPGVGPSLFWQLVVGNQSSVSALSSYCPPSLYAVSVLNPTLTSPFDCPLPEVANATADVSPSDATVGLLFDTSGRSVVQLDGANFGPNISAVVVLATQVRTLFVPCGHW